MVRVNCDMKCSLKKGIHACMKMIMNRKKRKICQAAVLTVLFCLLIIQLNHVLAFRYEDGILQMEAFYKLPENSVDVLVLGSSHAYVDIDPAILYEKQGITAYNLCASMQPMWNTYYTLKEALNYQTPKLIVLDLYRMVDEFDYAKESKLIKSTFGMRPSRNKMNAIRESLPKERQDEAWLYFLEFPCYHGRYDEVTWADFSWKKQYDASYRGNITLDEVQPMERPALSGVTEKIPVTEKTEHYFREILSLAKERQIPVLLILTPYCMNEDDKKVFLSVEDIIAEYDGENVNYIDFNQYYDEIGIDFETDFADYDHLNRKGMTKFSAYLADVLENEL